MSLNKKLMDLYKHETGLTATYKSGGSTYHFLGYVDWLENRASEQREAVQTSHNSASLQVMLTKFMKESPSISGSERLLLNTFMVWAHNQQV